MKPAISYLKNLSLLCLISSTPLRSQEVTIDRKVGFENFKNQINVESIQMPDRNMTVQFCEKSTEQQQDAGNLRSRNRKCTCETIKIQCLDNNSDLPTGTAAACDRSKCLIIMKEKLCATLGLITGQVMSVDNILDDSEKSIAIDGRPSTEKLWATCILAHEAVHACIGRSELCRTEIFAFNSSIICFHKYIEAYCPIADNSRDCLILRAYLTESVMALNHNRCLCNGIKVNKCLELCRKNYPKNSDYCNVLADLYF